MKISPAVEEKARRNVSGLFFLLKKPFFRLFR
nr:MAG TPA: hypothetical protein [Caudoviricetes sp.]